MFLKFFSKNLGQKSAAKNAGGEHGIDPEMNYCPSCGDEYRAGTIKCGPCNVDLISGALKLEQVLQKQEVLAERSMKILPGDDLVNIQKGGVKDIKALQKLLALERIPAVIAGDENSCKKGCCGPELFLQIKKDDIEAARQVLARDFIKSTALDSHDLLDATAVFDHQATETVCPACGCKFSPTVGACPECGLCFE